MLQATIVRFVNKYLFFFEITCITAVAIGLLMKEGGNRGGEQLVMIFSSLLAAVYFFTGMPGSPYTFGTSRKEPQKFFPSLTTEFIPNAAWVGCAIGVEGSLFTFLDLNGAHEMVMISSVALTADITLMVIILLFKPELFSKYRPILYRAVPIGILSIYFFLNTAPDNSTPL